MPFKLWEIVELLKRELNLKGNSADVVAESCAQLNVADRAAHRDAPHKRLDLLEGGMTGK